MEKKETHGRRTRYETHAAASLTLTHTPSHGREERVVALRFVKLQQHAGRAAATSEKAGVLFETRAHDCASMRAGVVQDCRSAEAANSVFRGLSYARTGAFDWAIRAFSVSTGRAMTCAFSRCILAFSRTARAAHSADSWQGLLTANNQYRA